MEFQAFALPFFFPPGGVARRTKSRSVSRTKGLASCNVEVGVGMSCSMVGSSRDAFLFYASLLARVLVAKPGSTFAEHAHEKGRPVSRLPFGASSFEDSAGSSGPGGLHLVHRLLGRSFRHREYRYEGAAACFRTKLDLAFDLGEQGMVGAHADIKAGMPGGAALTRDDVTGNHVLTAVRLDSKPLAGRITAYGGEH